jgi:methyl-accepting chemotaxis protein
MFRDWTFGQKVGAGFAAVIGLAIVVSCIGIWALRTVVSHKDRVISVDAQSLTDAQRLTVHASRKSTALRGYLLVRDERHLGEMKSQQQAFAALLADMREQLAEPLGRKLLAEMDQRSKDLDEAAERLHAMVRAGATSDQVERFFEGEITPRRERLVAAIDDFTAHREKILEQNTAAATEVAERATELTIGVTLGMVITGILMALFLARTISSQVGTAVAQVQSSSAELQAAATQQATASKEQSTAMTEIATTITELLATSRQIAESAQRVARVAEQTSDSARVGDTTVERANNSIASIRRQVEQIVSQMVELGKKSQQIGAVLDIVSELAEQTNILAINATIEAAGAGDSGRRFAVVADEIRKLADRVSGSTKQIRALIDDVRNSVNLTVMTTETGSKAVDAGSKQFNEVASAFKQIASLLVTTTEAAREIGLSTKQQATAVEQVNVAITSVAQATKETEASSGQTLQTASQLSGLSRELLRLVQPEQRARGFELSA